ncbi:helix-turn-helix domain-containing protein [Sutcliffiella rhizosphaerae]|uniref:Cytoskeleton protein RodZ-like C-terminal domain-containing protein n=1 Tax=Sutcliffiella rhizosphaerae TaxID=2880967 RepID=A0ABM8YIB9_9BACI|nr:RodZ domain-containing protein [Sutcliffiella rhizosphaerae]CAG9619646.1 hypothetical protein BACCIP111883_00414 [Sutcliffiella rhizosphaerae]
MTELGNKLKQTREEKGLSLDDLQTITKIQKRYLIGVEEGNYDIMPGQFYARAFIRQYSEAVGLDPDVMFEEYANDIPANEKEEIPPLSRVKTKKQVPSSKNTKVWNFIPKVLLFLALIAVIAIIYVIIQNVGLGNSPGSQPDKEPVLIDTGDTGNEDQDDQEGESGQPDDTEENSANEPLSSGVLSEVSTSGSNATLELSETDKFEVELASTGRTWVGISNAAGETFLSAELAEGDTESFDFTDEEEVVFNVGWVPDTQITINGEPFEFPFPVDQVTTQRITIKFLPNGEQ